MPSTKQSSVPMDWVTRVPVTRAVYYGPETPGRIGVIRRLHVTRASVSSDQEEVGRVTLSLGRENPNGDSYGVEVDFTPLGCHQLSALLLAAADHVDAGGEPKDFKLDPGGVGD